MKVIPPVTLNSTNTTSNAPTTSDPAAWSIATAYTATQKVQVASLTNKIYQCVTAVTGGFSPEIDVTKSIPKWIEISSTNKYAMFDTLRDTATWADYTLTVTLTPGQIVDSLALLGMVGVTGIHITATGTGISYDQTFDVNDRFTYSWYTYFFGYFRTKKALATFNIPSTSADIVITIVFTGTVGMTIGACVVGTSIDIGNVQRGASVDVDNYSSINRDLYGNAELVQRRNVPKTRQTLYIDKSRLNTLITTKNLLDATPAVWSGHNDDYLNDYFNALLILGVYRSFTFDISDPIGVRINLELEEI